MKTLIISAISAFSVGVAVGYRITTDSLERENSLLLESQVAKSQDYQKRLDKAILERDKAISDAAYLRDSVTDLARRLRVAKSDDTGVSGDSVGICERRLRKCRNLLAEGVELSGEGEQLVKRLNADRQAIRNLMR